MDDIKRALLGDHEAAKRLTEAGALLPCPNCGKVARVRCKDISVGAQHVILYGVKCDMLSCYAKTQAGPFGDLRSAFEAWNTRAPILSAEEMEMLDV